MTPIMIKNHQMFCKMRKLIKIRPLLNTCRAGRWRRQSGYRSRALLSDLALPNNVTRRRTRLFVDFQYLLDGAGIASRYTRERLLHYGGNGRKRDSASEKSFDGDLIGRVERAGSRSTGAEGLAS